MSRPRSLSSGWLFLFPTLLTITHPLASAEPLRCTQDFVCRSHLDEAVALDLARNLRFAEREAF